jgi:hypothetical protein
MGLCYQTSRWLDRLWSEHLNVSEPARRLVQRGVEKQGEPFAGFPADLHARLYLPRDPESEPCSLEWASRLHTLASELGEWQRLRVMCARNGFAAGIATEVLLEQLLPHVPDAPSAASNGQLDHAGGSSPPKGPDAPSAPSDSDIRAALRRATRVARDAVQQAEEGLEGTATSLGWTKAGGAVQSAGRANLKDIRCMYGLLSSSRRLQRITELAGRLERVAAKKGRSRIDPGVGEIHGVGLGGLGDLTRILPAELVGLRCRPLRRAFLSRLLDGRVLTYAMSGREPLARGPVVVLLDESASMRDDSKDVWSKAVALALLSKATEQRRAWHLVAFNGAIVRDLAIEPGKATPGDLARALDHRCNGGTDFDPPILRAIELVETSPTMKQADVVVITDGEDDLDDSTVSAATALTHQTGTSWFVIGVGPDAERSMQSLAPIATSMVRVRQVADSDDLVAPVINLHRA